MLISPAYAQAAGGTGGFDILTLAPLIAIFVVFYFLLIRPQQKKMKQHKAMIAGIRRGDTIVTGGGIIGRVSKVVDASELVVEIASGVKVRIAANTNTILDVRAKSEPVAATKAQPKEKKVGVERQIRTMDFYKVLGVKRNAASEQISAAYRKLAKSYHPSANPKDNDATERFQEISKAYQILGNPDLKEEYDAVGHEKFLASHGN